MVRYFILLVDAVKNAREANLLVVGLVDWRALVLSLKEALAGSKAFFFNFLLKRAQLLQTLAKPLNKKFSHIFVLCPFQERIRWYVNFTSSMNRLKTYLRALGPCLALFGSTDTV